MADRNGEIEIEPIGSENKTASKIGFENIRPDIAFIRAHIAWVKTLLRYFICQPV